MITARDVSRLFTRRRARGRFPLAAAAAGLGAGIMYLADPDRGARRRALVRDKGVHAARRLGELVDKASRDLRYRFRGIAAETRAIVRANHPSDEVIAQRVRAKLGRVATHPHPIHVAVNNGCVRLEGPILRDEIRSLVTGVLAVPGVTGVENRLEPRDRGPHEEDPDDERRQLSREQWSPMTRVALGVIGAGLVAHGVTKRGKLGLCTAAAGATLLLRDIANRPLRRVLGVGVGLRAVEFHKTFVVRAPVEEVYDFFTRVENFPRFMAHVQKIDKLDDDRYRWVADGPLHVPVTWEGTVTRRVPNEVFAWRSVPGAAVGNTGVARFERAGDAATRVDIQMSYNPPLGAVGHAVAAMFGADPKHAMDEDLVRFQSLLERGKTTAHHKKVLAGDVGLKR